TDFALVRYNTDGSLDTSFDGDGKVTTLIGTGSANDEAFSVAIQPDGKIVAAGSSSGNFAIARYNSDGSLDTAFSADGKHTTDFGSGSDGGESVVIQPDGKIVVVGQNNYDFAIVRYTADGIEDASFDGDGKAVVQITSTGNDRAYAVALQDDGRIVMAGQGYVSTGYHDWAVARMAPTMAYWEGDGAKVICGDISPITDGDDTGLASATVQITNYVNTEDYLALQSGYVLPGGITDVSWNSAEGMLTITGPATLAEYEAVLEHVTYRNDFNEPNTNPRTVSWKVNDGTDESTAQVSIINVAAVNDGPDAVNDLYSTDEDLILNVQADGVLENDEDPDTSDTLTVTGFNLTGTVGIVTWYSDGSFTYDPNDQFESLEAGQTAEDTWTYTVSDGHGGTDTATVRVTVTGVNDAASISGTATGSLTEDDATTQATGTLTVDDPDNGEEVFQTPGGLTGTYGLFTFDDLSGYWTYTIDNGDADTNALAEGQVVHDTLTVWSVDGTAHQLIDITITGANDSPTISVGAGSLDSGFGGDGIVSTQFTSGVGEAYATAIQSDGKIVVVGAASPENGYDWDFAVVRYNIDGSLDTSFGGGKVITNLQGYDTYNDTAYSVAIQSDGKIVVVGETYVSGSGDNFALVRHNSDGTYDTSFGTNGIVITAVSSSDDCARSVAIQSDGKIVVAGLALNGSTSDFALVRYNSDGSLDDTFDGDSDTGNGIVTTDIGGSNDYGYSVGIQSDNKIVVAGYTVSGSYAEVALVRYDSFGRLDTTFDADGNLDGIVTQNIGNRSDFGYSLAIQSDDKIVVAGFAADYSTNGKVAVLRYDGDGRLDTSFDGDSGTGNGIVLTDIGGSNDLARAVALQSDGKIVVAGYSYTGSHDDFAMVRYDGDGRLDTTFDADGKLTTPVGDANGRAMAVAIQADGRIVAAGYSSEPGDNFAVVRYNDGGSLDTSFSGDGKVTSVNFGRDSGEAVAIQPDGKIVVAGTAKDLNCDFAVARYNADGTLDTTFDGDGWATVTDFDRAYSVAIQSDGKIVVVGQTYISGSGGWNFALVRYNSDGSLDTSFDGDGKVTTPINGGAYAKSVAIMSDNKIVVVGTGHNGSNWDLAVVRYNSDGSLDTEFDGDGIVLTALSAGSYDYGYAVAVQSNGQIVALGSFGLVRYTSNGSVDTSFGDNGVRYLDTYFAYSLAIQADDKIVAVGSDWDDSLDDYVFAVYRCTANGSLDTSFSGDGKVMTDVGSSFDRARSVTIQPDGMIVVAGETEIASESDLAVVRYTSAGNLDTSFGDNGITTINVGNAGDSGNSVAIQPDGRIVVAGTSQYGVPGSTYTSSFTVIRYNATDQVAYIEGSGPQVIDGGLTLIDPDSVNMASATVQITGNYVGAEDVLSIDPADFRGGIDADWDPGTGTLALSNSASAADYEFMLRHVKYTNSSEDPSTAVRTVTWTVTDGLLQSAPKTVNIAVSAAAPNTAPTLTDNGSFAAIYEDIPDASNPGQTVGEIVGDTITDPDYGAVEGIAVLYAHNGAAGTWEYTTDDGTTWTEFTGLSETTATLVADNAATRIRFSPAQDFNTEMEPVSMPFIEYRAWDQTAGSNGQTGVDVTFPELTGGETAFSNESWHAEIEVTAVNDAPTITSGGMPWSIPQDVEDASNQGETVELLFGMGMADVDDIMMPMGTIGVAVVGADNSHGDWQYSLLGDGSDWTVFGAVSDTSAILLAPTAKIRFVPDTGWWGDAAITARAWDQTSGSAGQTGVDVSTNGGTSAFSSGTGIQTIMVMAGPNTAPTLTGMGSFAAIYEDIPAASNEGQTVGEIVGSTITDPDFGALKGIAVTGIGPTTGGDWEYTIDDGTTWTSFGWVMPHEAILLADNASTRIRFSPLPDFNTEIESSPFFGYQAWDQTSGVNGGTANLSFPGGGETAFSEGSAWAEIEITAVNDAPMIDGMVMPMTESPDGDSVEYLFGMALTDVDNGMGGMYPGTMGVAVMGSDSAGLGTWQYSVLGDGSDWTTFGSLSDSSAVLLAPASKIRFVISGSGFAEVTLTVRAWDMTSGAAGQTVDVSTNGGTTAFSENTGFEWLIVST
ncbi:MAG: VCBS domain-containing protein, partial [Pseudomonadota bacterium]